MKKQRVGAIVLAGMMMLSMTGCGNSKAKAYSKYVTLGDYKGIEYTKTVAEATEDDIQSKLDSFVDGLAETNEVTDRAVEDGDIVNIDYVGTMDGEEFDGGSATGQDLTIGSNSFIDGFETGKGQRCLESLFIFTGIDLGCYFRYPVPSDVFRI